MFGEEVVRSVGTPASVLTASCLNSSPSGPPCAVTMTLYSAEEKTALSEFTIAVARNAECLRIYDQRNLEPSSV